MRQLINDYFYPLSRVEEYFGKSFSVYLLCAFCIASSAFAFAFALTWPFDLKPAATCYAASALCLIALNFRLGVLIGESENPPLS